MVMARDRRSAARRAGLFADLASLLHDLSRSIFDGYRPELHYMRGPGPKWHARHDPAPRQQAVFQGVPALVRVRVKA
jgi:hypothetical protein